MTEHVLCSVVVFADGEESISVPFARGSCGECERVRELIGAVAVSDARPVLCAALEIMPADAYDALEREGGAA